MKAGRVLVVAYNFPPHGAVGTLRTLRLVRELAQRGWDVTVLAGAPATYLEGDPLEPGLLSAIPESVRVVRQRALRPVTAAQRLARRLLRGASALKADEGKNDASGSPAARNQPARLGYARRAVAAIDMLTSIPDYESGWILPAVSRGLAIAMRERPDVIYSTAPPWSAQVAAYLLALGTGSSWVADFRDPWSRAPWRNDQARLSQRASSVFERRVVGRADAVVFNTRTAREEFAYTYGGRIATKLHVVANGCDVNDFVGLERRPQGSFVLLHAGTLYGGRNPRTLLEAIASAVRHGRIDRERFRLRFLGLAAVPGLRESVADLGVQDLVEFENRTPRRESLEAMVSASALLLLQPGHALSVPAKTYEYMAAGRPILAIADEGETARVIVESGAGVVARSDDIRGIEAALLKIIEMVNRGVAAPERALFDGGMRAGELADVLTLAARAKSRQTLAGVQAETGEGRRA